MFLQKFALGWTSSDETISQSERLRSGGSWNGLLQGPNQPTCDTVSSSVASTQKPVYQYKAMVPEEVDGEERELAESVTMQYQS